MPLHPMQVRSGHAVADARREQQRGSAFHQAREPDGPLDDALRVEPVRGAEHVHGIGPGRGKWRKL